MKSKRQLRNEILEDVQKITPSLSNEERYILRSKIKSKINDYLDLKDVEESSFDQKILSIIFYSFLVIKITSLSNYIEISWLDVLIPFIFIIINGILIRINNK